MQTTIKDDKIIIQKGGGWMTAIEEKSYKKMFRDHQRRLAHILLYATAEDRQKQEIRKKRVDRRVYAYCYVANTKMIVLYDTETKKAYKLGAGYEHTWIEWKRFSFIRFCTLMDI